MNDLRDRIARAVKPHAPNDTHTIAAAVMEVVEADGIRRLAYTERRVELARKAEAAGWERRMREELEARDAERDETVNSLAMDLQNAERENRRLTAENAKLKR